MLSLLRSLSSDALWVPIPGQKLLDALGRMIRQPREHVGEPGLRVNVVELGGGDERHPASTASTGSIAKRDWPCANAEVAARR